MLMWRRLCWNVVLICQLLQEGSLKFDEWRRETPGDKQPFTPRIMKANFTSENFVVCFDGFYNRRARGDCLLAPPTNSARFRNIARSEFMEQMFLQNVPTINTTVECFIFFSLGNGPTIEAANFGSQAALMFLFLSPGTAVLDVLLKGNKVNKLYVTNTLTRSQTADFIDVSGCRHEGVAYKPGTTTVIPERCETVSCNPQAVLNVSTCGPVETCLGNNRCVNTTAPPPTTTTNTTTPPPNSTTTNAGPAVGGRQLQILLLLALIAVFILLILFILLFIFLLKWTKLLSQHFSQFASTGQLPL